MANFRFQLPPFARTSELIANSKEPAGIAVPNEPFIPASRPAINCFLSKELECRVLDELAPYFFVFCKRHNEHVDALHEYAINGLHVAIAEDPGLHLVRKYNAIYIKPIPHCLFNYDFWQTYLIPEDQGDEQHLTIRSDRQNSSRKAQFRPASNEDRKLSITCRSALGLLRSYGYLIKHESDFHIARENNLIPKHVTYTQFQHFIQSFRNIPDTCVSPRYQYGHIRMTRLNMAVRLYARTSRTAPRRRVGQAAWSSDNTQPTSRRHHPLHHCLSVAVLYSHSWLSSVAAASKMADRYSFSLTTFSPSGKLVQIEYALNAVNQGVTSLGIKATNGIVLATEKKSSSPLIDSSSSSKVSLITPNIGMVYSGMGPDYRVLVDKARKVSHTGYKRIYNEYPPTRILVQDVARVMQEATQSGGVRPYGVSLLIAGWDDGIEPEAETKQTEGEADLEKKKINGKTGGILKGGPSLYQVDPSGSYFPWKATAIGKSATSAKTFLEKRYTEGLELEDAIHIALLTLKETIEGEMNGDTVEIGIIGPPEDRLLGFEGVEGAQGPRFRKLSPTEVEDYLTNL
ncbi:hypothetical protein GRF29_19g2884871 [Pseudopithomyces chartarum]|uniref:Proteasome alpha-type subunits domain-containing protein n=1 Tax=Pseudopithomyces chartarum TaxID=1892770 RepID=A0AAN6RJ81_9PLEO|nr:hypothetical protein GRF29_19g2884871 [Pseudopithomyces chartarum]